MTSSAWLASGVASKDREAVLSEIEAVKAGERIELALVLGTVPFEVPRAGYWRGVGRDVRLNGRHLGKAGNLFKNARVYVLTSMAMAEGSVLFKNAGKADSQRRAPAILPSETPATIPMRAMSAR
jgi:hypothetical protein